MKCHVDIWSIPTCVGILCSSWVVGKWPIEIFSPPHTTLLVLVSSFWTPLRGWHLAATTSSSTLSVASCILWLCAHCHSYLFLFLVHCGFYTTFLGDLCNLRGFTLDGVQMDVQNKFEHRCQRDTLWTPWIAHRKTKEREIPSCLSMCCCEDVDCLHVVYLCRCTYKYSTVDNILKRIACFKYLPCQWRTALCFASGSLFLGFSFQSVTNKKMVILRSSTTGTRWLMPLPPRNGLQAQVEQSSHEVLRLVLVWRPISYCLLKPESGSLVGDEGRVSTNSHHKNRLPKEKRPMQGLQWPYSCTADLLHHGPTGHAWVGRGSDYHGLLEIWCLLQWAWRPGRPSFPYPA